MDTRRMEWHRAVQFMLDSPENIITPLNFAEDFARRPNNRKLLRIKDGELQYRFGLWKAGLWARSAKYDTCRPVSATKVPLFRVATEEELSLNAPLTAVAHAPNEANELSGPWDEFTEGLDASVRENLHTLAYAISLVMRR